jgi:hypothetical protein
LTKLRRQTRRTRSIEAGSNISLMIPIEVGHHSEMMSATSAGANQPSGRERREIGGSGYIQFYEAEAQPCSEIALIACIPNLSTLSFRRLAEPPALVP